MENSVTASYSQTSSSDGVLYHSGIMNSNPVLKFKQQNSLQANDYLLLYVPLKTLNYG